MRDFVTRSLLLAAFALPASAAGNPSLSSISIAWRDGAAPRASASTYSGSRVSLSARALESGEGTWGVDVTGVARLPRSWALEGQSPRRTRWDVEVEAWRAAGMAVFYAGAGLSRAGHLDEDPSRPVRRAYAGLEFSTAGAGMLQFESGWTRPAGAAFSEREVRIAWLWPLARRWSAGVDASRLSTPSWTDDAAGIFIRGTF